MEAAELFIKTKMQDCSSEQLEFVVEEASRERRVLVSQGTVFVDVAAVDMFIADGYLASWAGDVLREREIKAI